MSAGASYGADGADLRERRSGEVWSGLCGRKVADELRAFSRAAEALSGVSADALDAVADMSARRIEAVVAEAGCPDADAALSTARKFIIVAARRLRKDELEGACALACVLVEDDMRRTWGAGGGE